MRTQPRSTFATARPEKADWYALITSSACSSKTPDRASAAPGLQSLANSPASPSSGRARMFAIRMSKPVSVSDSCSASGLNWILNSFWTIADTSPSSGVSRPPSSRVSEEGKKHRKGTPFISALAWQLVIASRSISTPLAEPAPIFSATMPRRPLPAP
eukprot:scaffold977_cov253-Pinguiococcus_pyrenoidosus.AAC.37